jgi:TonB-dependent receptor
MTPPRCLYSSLLRFALSAFVLSTLAFTGYAQSSTGTLAGRVYDSATGRSLQGAIVRVQGTSGIDYTTVDGRFHIAGVPAGSVTLEVEYIGLDTHSQQVTVRPGTVTTINAALESRTLVMETFTVAETARGQALAINQQRTAAGIINIVSEETFGEILGGNIGYALNYLPSITMDEAQDGSVGGINIRGVESEYNALLIDGKRISTRGFDTRNISGDGITSIEVIKAPTPDRDGDAIGGMVDLKTRTAFQREGRWMNLKTEAILNDLPDKWGYGGSFSFSDLYSLGRGEKNFGVAFTLSHYKQNRYSINADIDWERIDAEGSPPQWNIGAQEASEGRPIWFMEATHWEWDMRVTKNYGVSASFDYRLDNYNTFYVRPTFGHYNRQGLTFETDIDIDTRYQFAPGGRKTYAEVGPHYGRGTPGSAGSRGKIQWIGTDDYRRNNTLSVAIGGQHERDNNLLSYDFVVSRDRLDIVRDLEFEVEFQPTNPYILWEYHLVAPWKGDIIINQLTNYDLSDPSLINHGHYLEDNRVVRTENTLMAQIDWERKFALERDQSFAFKTGAKYRTIDSKNIRTEKIWQTFADFPYEQVVVPWDEVLFMKPMYLRVYPQRALELLHTNPELFTLNVQDTLLNSSLPNRDGTEAVTAGYVMGTYRFGRHMIIGGVRWEQVKWSAKRFEADFNFVPEIDEHGEEHARRVLDTIRQTSYGRSYANFLPGIHFRHALTDRLILRESYNRSYGKPRLSELSGGRTVYSNGNIDEGNPNLKPVISDNFDVQLEYYTRHSGLYSIGVFYKDIKDFSYRNVYSFTETDATGTPIPAPSGLRYRKWENGTTAKNRGLELMARQRLFFLPGYLKGLHLDLSATFLDTDAHYPHRADRGDLPLPGFSDRVYTARVGYDWGNFRSRVSFRYRSDYVEGLGSAIQSDEFFGAQERLDAEMSYRVRKGLRLYAAGTNLSGRWLVSYQGYPYFTEDASYHGRKFTFGVDYTF